MAFFYCTQCLPEGKGGQFTLLSRTCKGCQRHCNPGEVVEYSTDPFAPPLTHTYTLVFPLLGNEKGRYMELLTSPDPPTFRHITEILNRYGDLFPRTGTAEIYRNNILIDYATWTYSRPGVWEIVFHPAPM